MREEFESFDTAKDDPEQKKYFDQRLPALGSEKMPPEEVAPDDPDYRKLRSYQRLRETPGMKPIFALAEAYHKLRAVPCPENIETVADLTGTAARAVAEKLHQELPKILEQTPWNQNERRAIGQAVDPTRSEWSLVDDSDNPELTKTALGLAMVVERARTQITADLLKNLDENTLRKFGMDPRVRDMLGEFLPRVSAVNPEFVRFKARALKGTAPQPEEKIVDAVRERRRVGIALSEAADFLRREDPAKLFGPSGGDFARYVEKLAVSHVSMKEGQPFPKKEHDRRIFAARQAFVDFYAEHPDFPLVVIPAVEHYVSDEAHKDFGLDPELRILWQSPQERKEAGAIEHLRDSFAEALCKKFPEYLAPDDVAGIRNMRAIVANELASCGINLKFRATAQDTERFHVLVKDLQERDFTDPIRKKLKTLLPSGYHDIVDHSGFSELSDYLLAFHEFTHRVFPEEGGAAERLGKIDDELAETKSDTLARAVFADVSRERAQELFGDRAAEATNLVMIGDDLETYSGSSPKGEDWPYWIGAVTRLNVLAEHGFFVEKDGHMALAEDKLKESMDVILEPYARDILRAYKLAADGPKEGVAEARTIGRRLINVKAEGLVKTLGETFKET